MDDINIIIDIDQVTRARRAQGLPPKVADAAALRRISVLVTTTKENGGGGDA